jgi:drug/metabolite transporter (DMT)-like permease
VKNLTISNSQVFLWPNKGVVFKIFVHGPKPYICHFKKKMGGKKSGLVAWLLFVGLALVWGSSFILMKRSLQSFSYLHIGALRIALAFLFTLLIAIPHLKFLKRDNWFPLFLVGIFGNALPYMLFPLAVTKLDSSVVGILNSTVPLFTLIIGIIWFRLKIKWVSILGIILGFLGALWLLVPGLKFESERLIYGVFPVIATVCYAISINVVNSRLKALKPLTITLLSLLFAGIPAIIYLFGSGFVEVMQVEEKAWASFGYVAILGVLSSSVAVIIFNYLIKNTSSLFAASVTYAIPVVALLWGIIDGEAVGLHHALGMLTILAGVYLVNSRGSLKDRLALREKAQKKRP